MMRKSELPKKKTSEENKLSRYEEELNELIMLSDETAIVCITWDLPEMFACITWDYLTLVALRVNSVNPSMIFYS